MNSRPLGDATMHREVRASTKCWRLSPSDLVFLLDDCTRCFWLKIARGVSRPRVPMAKIYLDIDRAMKSWLGGQRTEQVPGMRPGVFKFGEMWVESLPLEVPGHRAQVAIRGRFDIAAAYDDGAFGI